eukprot:TRINITY_DN347_c0_g4_i2.p1 TRINITY_DN347_c0_g4~~TRINITY_DN347_c0_g4_i2.p1  ORF type:complete len:573 (-),score=131.97 TRINITY_DN347_c0_g4_i2:1109-2827(-)
MCIRDRYQRRVHGEIFFVQKNKEKTMKIVALTSFAILLLLLKAAETRVISKEVPEVVSLEVPEGTTSLLPIPSNISTVFLSTESPSGQASSCSPYQPNLNYNSLYNYRYFRAGEFFPIVASVEDYFYFAMTTNLDLYGFRIDWASGGVDYLGHLMYGNDRRPDSSSFDMFYAPQLRLLAAITADRFFFYDIRTGDPQRLPFLFVNPMRFGFKLSIHTQGYLLLLGEDKEGIWVDSYDFRTLANLGYATTAHLKNLTKVTQIFEGTTLMAVDENEGLVALDLVNGTLSYNRTLFRTQALYKAHIPLGRPDVAWVVGHDSLGGTFALELYLNGETYTVNRRLADSLSDVNSITSDENYVYFEGDNVVSVALLAVTSEGSAEHLGFVDQRVFPDLKSIFVGKKQGNWLLAGVFMNLEFTLFNVSILPAGLRCIGQPGAKQSMTLVSLHFDCPEYQFASVTQKKGMICEERRKAEISFIHLYFSNEREALVIGLAVGIPFLLIALIVGYFLLRRSKNEYEKLQTNIEIQRKESAVRSPTTVAEAYQVFDNTGKRGPEAHFTFDPVKENIEGELNSP